MSVQDTVINEQDYVELGLNCADICRTLDLATNRKRPEDRLSQFVCKEMNKLTLWVKSVGQLRQLTDDTLNCRIVGEIQNKATEHSQRNPLSRFFHARGDKDMVAAWRLELSRISYVFNVRSVTSSLTLLIVRPQAELAMNAHAAASGLHRDIVSNICRTMSGRSGVIGDLLKRVGFDALSIVLLAATASHNAWSYHQLAKEWDIQCADIPRTDCNESLAATIELSITSPAFRKLGPDARGLLEVVAFFPQGVDENNFDWLFPTISDKGKILDELYALSLTHRNDSFITMLAPVRDYLRPQDPKSSPLLCAAKDRYFRRLSAEIDPRSPGFKEALWIKSEDVNVEHFLDVFTSIDAESNAVWKACANFVAHLRLHKQRHTLLASKMEGLSDGHRSKRRCLLELSRLCRSVGNYAEQKRFLTRLLELERERGSDSRIARTLGSLSYANLRLGSREEGTQQAKEALEIYERLGSAAGQASSFADLTSLLLSDLNQLEAAEEAASHAISLLPEKGRESEACRCHRSHGNTHRFKGEREKAIQRFEIALEVASNLGLHDHLSWVHISLASMYSREGKFDDAHAHIEQAKSQVVDDIYHLHKAITVQAKIWYRQRKFEDAKSAALRSLKVFEKLGAAKNRDKCRTLIQNIERATAGELLETRRLLHLLTPPQPVPHQPAPQLDPAFCAFSSGGNKLPA